MSSSTLFLLENFLNRYVMSTCLILGTIGNACNVFIFRKHRQSACSMYLLLASAMNICFLLSIISFSIYIYERGDPSIQSLIFCKLRMYFPHVWGQMGRYFIVLAAMDRFAVTSINATLRSFSRPLIARRLLIVLTILWHLLGIQTLMMTTIENRQCGQFGLYFIWYNVYSISTIAIVPLLLTTIFGLLAYLNMKRLRTRVGPIENGRDVTRGNVVLDRRNRQLLKMVVSEVFLHLITNILYPIIIIEVAATNDINIDKSPLRKQIENFIVLIGRILFYTGSAASFYVFYLVSRSFRREFKEMISNYSGRVIIVQPQIPNGQIIEERL